MNRINDLQGANGGLFQGKVSGIAERKETKQMKGGSIFAGDLNLEDDPIAKRKEQAQKQAMKLVQDTFAGEQKLDNSISEQKQKIEDLRGDALDAQAQIDNLNQQKEQMIEVSTPEEAEKFSAEIDGQMKVWEERAETARGSIANTNKALAAANLERLKSDPMVEAGNAAEDIMLNASKEAASSMLAEGKDNIDQAMEETEEKAEKIEEKKQEEEELKAKAEESKEESAAAASGETKELTQADAAQQEVKQQIKEMLKDQKLLEEDLKGIAVNMEL